MLDAASDGLGFPRAGGEHHERVVDGVVQAGGVAQRVVASLDREPEAVRAALGSAATASSRCASP